jgi:glycerol uptake facilitator-like aquaporin
MNKYIVEFLGTLLISFIVFAPRKYLVGGIALVLAVLLRNSISGSAFNPAIAFVYVVINQISYTEFILYNIAEILGALVGYWLVKKML